MDGPLRQWFDGQLDEDAWSGQYTDDSQLARELMQSYSDRATFDPSDYAQRIAALFIEDRVVGRGAATHQAAMRIAAGVSWKAAGAPPPSAGNGGAMRAGPIGLIFNDSRQMLQAARDQSWITHQDPRALAGSIAIAGAVYLASRSATIDPSPFIAQLSQWTATVDETFASCVAALSDFLRLPVDVAAKQISGLGLEPGRSSDGENISPFVVPSVIWSLFAFLHADHDYAQAVFTAIRGGGDVDTTAAMTGAISGAHLGLDGLPSHLVERIHDRNTWGAEDLTTLADRCFELVNA